MKQNLTGPKVVVVVYEQLCTFEFGIAVEVFGLPRPEFGNDWYRFEVCSAESQRVDATGGVQIQVDVGVEAIEKADVVIVPGWRNPHELPPVELVDAIVAAHERGARIAGICGGVFVLAATGLLANKSATTHWMFLDTFIDQHPDVRVEDTPMFCDMDRILTSAGSAAGIDLCLHIVATDYGQSRADQVARRLVVPPFSDSEARQDRGRPLTAPVSEKQQRMEGLLERLRLDIATPYSIQEASKELDISPRTFLRRFKSTTGKNYGQWMTQQRLERAKTLLVQTDLSVERIAEACGLSSSGSLRRIFRENLNVSPREYRGGRHQKSVNEP
ncbi:MAG: helix-turn-helix domain-containing protein [Planctomycetota bacterium]